MSPNLKKEMPIQKQQIYRTPIIKDNRRHSPYHFIVKITETQNSEMYQKLHEKSIKSLIKTGPPENIEQHLKPKGLGKKSLQAHRLLYQAKLYLL